MLGRVRLGYVGRRREGETRPKFGPHVLRRAVLISRYLRTRRARAAPCNLWRAFEPPRVFLYPLLLFSRCIQVSQSSLSARSRTNTRVITRDNDKTKHWRNERASERASSVYIPRALLSSRALTRRNRRTIRIRRGKAATSFEQRNDL